MCPIYTIGILLYYHHTRPGIDATFPRTSAQLQPASLVPTLALASLERVDGLGLLDGLFDLPSRLFKKHRRIVKLCREAGLIEERTECVCDGAGERLQVVPSFQEEYAATTTELLRQLLDARCQHVERARCKLQAGQGVQCVRIIPEKDMKEFCSAWRK